MDYSTPSLTWHESTPDTWERDLDEVERFWAQAARAFDNQGRRPFTITGHATLRVDQKITSLPGSVGVNTALKRAWCRIRQDHPSVASRVVYDFNDAKFTRIYNTICNDDDRDAWLKATFFEVSSSQSGEKFANSDPPAPDLPTIFVITPSPVEQDVDCREIIFRAPHETIDGIGTLLLLGNYLKHASEALERGVSYTFPKLNGSEVHNLSPPYRSAANIPKELSPDQKSKVERIFSDHVFSAKTNDHKEYLVLPFKQGALVPGRHQRIGTTIDRNETAQLLAACKRAGVTVTHAFNAAIPFALRGLNSPSQHQELYYRCDLLRNLRPFCTNPFNTSKHPVTAYHVGSISGFETKITMQANEQKIQEEFHRVLREMKSFYQRVSSDPDHPSLAPSVWKYWLRTLPDLEEKPPAGPPPSPTPSVTLSSLGRVDELLPPKTGLFDVSDPWITGEEMGNGYGIFLTSYRDEINLAVAYNDAWHGEDDVQQFLQLFMQILRTSLQLD